MSFSINPNFSSNSNQNISNNNQNTSRKRQKEESTNAIVASKLPRNEKAKKSALPKKSKVSSKEGATNQKMQRSAQEAFSTSNQNQPRVVEENSQPLPMSMPDSMPIPASMIEAFQMLHSSVIQFLDGSFLISKRASINAYNSWENIYNSLHQQCGSHNFSALQFLGSKFLQLIKIQVDTKKLEIHLTPISSLTFVKELLTSILKAMETIPYNDLRMDFAKELYRSLLVQINDLSRIPIPNVPQNPFSDSNTQETPIWMKGYMELYLIKTQLILLADVFANFPNLSSFSNELKNLPSFLDWHFSSNPKERLYVELHGSMEDFRKRVVTLQTSIHECDKQDRGVHDQCVFTYNVLVEFLAFTERVQAKSAVSEST